jgi:outer membrane protein assembly factor BamD
MAPHVEDARDRLVAMNRPVPEPTHAAAIAENDAEVRSQQPLHFTDKLFDIIKHGPTVVSRPRMWAIPPLKIPDGFSRPTLPTRTRR